MFEAWGGNLRERNHLEKLGVNGMLIQGGSNMTGTDYTQVTHK